MKDSIASSMDRKRPHSLFLALGRRIFNEEIKGVRGVLGTVMLFFGFILTVVYVKSIAVVRIPLLSKVYLKLYLLAKSLRDKNKTDHILSFIREGDHIVDVGAGAGFFMRLAAKRVGPTGMVTCIEPEAISRNLLQININSLPKTACQHYNIIDVAVGDKKGEVSLYVCESNLGESSLAELDVTDARYNVNVELLDTLRLNWRPVRLLKIDTQGSEVRILRGARELLATDRPTILVEYWPFGLVQNSCLPNDLLTIFFELGYRLFRLDVSGYPEVMSLRDLQEITPSNRRQCDLLCLPE